MMDDDPSSKQMVEEVRATVARLKSAGVDARELDGLVSRVMDVRSSDINNGGVTSQVRFLLKAGMDADLILKEVRGP